MKRYLLTAFCLAMVFAVLQTANAQQSPKYIFLFIGDGMSIPQRMMADEFLKQAGEEPLLINQLPNHALTTTRSANALITDSAASGTAIACGEKTSNGTIGMDDKHERNLESVAEVAKQCGRKVAIMTTVTINHATPSSFYAHNPSRGNYYQLGLDLVASGFNYFGGGGVDSCDAKNDPKYAGNIYELAAQQGYEVHRGIESVKAFKPGADKVICTGHSAKLPFSLDRASDDWGLSDYVRQAISVVDNPDGFFLMAEGGAVDYACHGNDAATALGEIIDLDKAVRVAYEFAQQHEGETLIVVTGDHETGGLTLGFAGTGFTPRFALLKNQRCSYEGLASKLIALGANKDVAVTFEQAQSVITANLGLIFPTEENKDDKSGLRLSDNEAKTLLASFDRMFPNGHYSGNACLSGDAIRILDTKAELAWTSNNHTALPVYTTAYGAKSELFMNVKDNTMVSQTLKKIIRGL